MGIVICNMQKSSETHPLLLPIDLDTASEVILSGIDGAIEVSYVTGSDQEFGAFMFNPTSIQKITELGQFIVRGETVPPTHKVMIHVNPLDSSLRHGTVTLTEIPSTV